MKTDFSSVNGKVAVVTGAGSGIGRAIAKVFAANGMRVVIADIQDHDGQQVAEEIVQAGGQAVFCHANVMQEADIVTAIDMAVQTYGQLHVMVNNAGIGTDLRPIHEFDTDVYRRATDINFIGTFLGIKHSVKAMLNTKARGCAVINISSANGLVTTANYSCYDSTKAAVLQMTHTAGLDYAKHDITVNAICPGVIDTPIYSKLSPEQRDISIAKVPMGRFGRPEEIAYMALFLASDMARFITGAVFSVDGGQVAGDYLEVPWHEPDPRNL